MKITLLLRVPFLDKIPSLKTLIAYLACKGVEINIISTVDGKYPISDFKEYPNIKMTLVKQRTKKFDLPTSIKLLLVALKSILFHKSDFYIGGDAMGCHLLCYLKKVISFKYINFVLEYPDINNHNELREIEAADYIITHDHWHSEFIGKYCSIKQERILYLPNASYTDVHTDHGNYLSKKLNIPYDKSILLHSGGLGEWFCCKELAHSAKDWEPSYVLVFHTSHIVENSSYFKEMKNEIGNSNKVLFSIKPVSNVELDKLVASAKIGIATYSLKHLGYRAENMGLAAGKIGNYLKCGVPVIATKVHSLSYIEDYHCGILIDNFDEINSAVKKIIADYDNYVTGAYRCYNELWHPKNYLDVIYKVLAEV